MDGEEDSNMQILTASFTLSELQDVLKIYKEFYTEFYCCNEEELIEIEKEIYGENYPFLSLENLIKSLKKHNVRLYILKNKNIVVGFAYLRIFKERAYLDEIHIRKEFRGKGYGTLLLHYIENELKKENIKKIVLDASPESIRFYKKNGFAMTNIRFGEWIRMEKVLTHKREIIPKMC